MNGVENRDALTRRDGTAGEAHDDARRFDVFCDFDGTISETDIVTAIAREFAPREAPGILRRITAGEISIRDGVDRLMALVPSGRFPDVRAFARRQVRMRAGFPEFVDLCAKERWPLYVVSGGFDFFVEHALEGYGDKVRVFANKIDATGEHLRVMWPHPCDARCTVGECGMCKPTVMRTVGRGAARILVGDGTTDLAAAAVSDFIYARDRLLAHCQMLGLKHMAFATFFDIVADLRQGRGVEAGGRDS